MATNFSIPDWFLKLLARLRRTRSSPHDIAKSFAVGVFIGIMPGTGLAVALLVAIFFRLNKAAIAVGALMNNPWTTLPIYAASYHIGHWVLQSKTHVALGELFSWHGFTFKEFGLALTPFLVGGFLLALLSAVAAYFIVYFLITFYKKKKILKHPPPPNGNPL